MSTLLPSFRILVLKQTSRLLLLLCALCLLASSTALASDMKINKKVRYGGGEFDNVLTVVFKGESFTYLLEVQATVQASPSATVTDMVPEGMEITEVRIPAGKGTCTQEGQKVTCNLGAMATGETVVIEVDVEATLTGIYINDASVKGGAFDPGNNNNNNAETVQVGNAVDLSIDKASPAELPTSGVDEDDNPDNNDDDLIPYTIKVTNNSTEHAAEDVHVTDPLPSEVTVVSITPSKGSCIQEGNTVNCDLGTIAPGGEVTIEILVEAQQAGRLENIATVEQRDGNSFDPNDFNNSNGAIELVFDLADLALTKTIKDAPDHILLGETITYELKLENLGPRDATEVDARDWLPDDISYELITFSSTKGTCEQSGHHIECDIGDLAVGEVVTMEVQVKPLTTGRFINNGSISGLVEDPILTNNGPGLGLGIDVVVPSDLSVTKTSSESPVWPGQEITFTITVTNNGPADVENVEVEDDFPDDLVVNGSMLPEGCTMIVNIVKCMTGPLANGASKSFEIKATLDKNYVGTFSNTAQLSEGLTADPNAENNSSTVEVPVREVVTKIADRNTVFHRLNILGEAPNGWGNPWEGDKRLGDFYEYRNDLFTSENEAAGSGHTLLMQPSKARLQAVLDSLKNVAQPGEEVTFMYQGHGWDGVDDAGTVYGGDDESAGGDETIMINGRDDLTDDDLAEMLQGFRPGVTLVVILSSCYGGNFLDGDNDIKESLGVTVVGVGGTCPQDGLEIFPSAFLVETFTEAIADGAGEREADGDGDGTVTGTELKDWLKAEGWDVTFVSNRKGGGGEDADEGRIKDGESECYSNEIGPCPGLPTAIVKTVLNPEDASLHLQISGTFFAPGAVVQFEVIDVDTVRTDLGQVTTDVAGAFEVDVEVPADLEGLYELDIRDTEGYNDQWVLRIGSTLTIDAESDTEDANIGDGLCDDGTGSCSLRAAFQEANFAPGLEVIDLSDALSATPKKPLLIRPQSPLPTLIDAVVLNGGGQLTLDGRDAGTEADGLTLTGGSSIVQDLAITGFGGHGLVLREQGGNVVERVTLGTDAGNTDLGNGGAGVFIDQANDNRIGGTASEQGNVIAFNKGGGVVVAGGNGNAIQSNTLFSNAGPGIDLGGDGETANDTGDTDEGPNLLQNYPEIMGMDFVGDNVEIRYRIPSAAASAAYPITVEFYKADADGDDGQMRVGTDLYEAVDADQEKIFQLQPEVAVQAGDPIIATATDAAGNTSEFTHGTLTRVAIETPDEEVPVTFHLYQNYPNPFNPVTTIQFDVKERTKVLLKVYNVLGREVVTLVDGIQAPGRHVVSFSARDLPSGLYMYRVSMGAFEDVKTMLLVK